MTNERNETLAHITEIASAYASRTEFGEVIFPGQSWELFVAALAAPGAAIDARGPVVTDDMRSLANYYLNAKQPTREEVEAEEVTEAELEPMVERLHKGMRALAPREGPPAVTCKAEQSRWGAHLYICDGMDCDRCTRTVASRSEAQPHP